MLNEPYEIGLSPIQRILIGRLARSVKQHFCYDMQYEPERDVVDRWFTLAAENRLEGDERSCTVAFKFQNEVAHSPLDLRMNVFHNGDMVTKVFDVPEHLLPSVVTNILSSTAFRLKLLERPDNSDLADLIPKHD